MLEMLHLAGQIVGIGDHLDGLSEVQGEQADEGLGIHADAVVQGVQEDLVVTGTGDLLKPLELGNELNCISIIMIHTSFISPKSISWR